MRYMTVAYCIDDDCMCLDRDGVILYNGPDLQAAEEAVSQAPTGYEVRIEQF